MNPTNIIEVLLLVIHSMKHGEETTNDKRMFLPSRIFIKAILCGTSII